GVGYAKRIHSRLSSGRRSGRAPLLQHASKFARLPRIETMAALFPPSSNTVLRVALVAIAISVLVSILLLMVFVRTAWRMLQFDALEQPVEFDHRHHTEDDGIHCVYCHNTVYSTATAGIPSTDKCMGCHSQIWVQSPLITPVRQSYLAGTPIPWNRVHNIPG